MNHDTPLSEVAAMIPADAARVLMTYPVPVQETVVRMVRGVIVSLERQNHTLDPIQLEAVLNIYVASTTALVSEIYEMGRRARGE